MKKLLTSAWFWVAIVAAAVIAWLFLRSSGRPRLSVLTDWGTKAPTDANTSQSDLSTMYESAPPVRISAAPASPYTGAFSPAERNSRRITMQ